MIRLAVGFLLLAVLGAYAVWANAPRPPSPAIIGDPCCTPQATEAGRSLTPDHLRQVERVAAH